MTILPNPITPLCWCGKPALMVNPGTSASNAHLVCAEHIDEGYAPIVAGDFLHLVPGHTAIVEAAFALMEAILDSTPDNGEGSRSHLRSDALWVLREDYRRLTDERDKQDVLDDYTEGMTPDQIRLAIVGEAVRLAGKWVEEDRKP